MKKVTFLAISFAILSLVSCSKERTCSCTTTETNNGTYYSVEWDAAASQYVQYTNPVNDTDQSSSDVVYDKVSKKFGKQNCPKTNSFVNPYDYTNELAPGLLEGGKGQYTYTTSCELE